MKRSRTYNPGAASSISAEAFRRQQAAPVFAWKKEWVVPGGGEVREGASPYKVRKFVKTTQRVDLKRNLPPSTSTLPENEIEGDEAVDVDADVEMDDMEVDEGEGEVENAENGEHEGEEGEDTVDPESATKMQGESNAENVLQTVQHTALPVDVSTNPAMVAESQTTHIANPTSANDGASPAVTNAAPDGLDESTENLATDDGPLLIPGDTQQSGPAPIINLNTGTPAKFQASLNLLPPTQNPSSSESLNIPNTQTPLTPGSPLARTRRKSPSPSPSIIPPSPSRMTRSRSKTPTPDPERIAADPGKTALVDQPIALPLNTVDEEGNDTVPGNLKSPSPAPALRLNGREREKSLEQETPMQSNAIEAIPSSTSTDSQFGGIPSTESDPKMNFTHAKAKSNEMEIEVEGHTDPSEVFGEGDMVGAGGMKDLQDVEFGKDGDA